MTEEFGCNGKCENSDVIKCNGVCELKTMRESGSGIEKDWGIKCDGVTKIFGGSRRKSGMGGMVPYCGCEEKQGKGKNWERGGGKSEEKEGTGSTSAWPGGGRCSRPRPTSPSAQPGLGPRPRGRFGKVGRENENLLKKSQFIKQSR